MNGERGPGIVYFKCDDCGAEWIEATRDSQSPSSERCYCSQTVQPVLATTAQFDSLKFKVAPSGSVPVMVTDAEVLRLNNLIGVLRNEMAELNRDAMYCPHCACHSCDEERSKRDREDVW